MNKTDKYTKKHPLDNNAAKGLSLFDTTADAEQATQAFTNRLEQKYPIRSKRRSIRTLMTLAAGILLALGLWGGLQLLDQPSNNNWFAEHEWRIEPGQPMVSAALAPNRDRRESAEESLEKGRQAYRTGEFEIAVRALTSYLKQSPEPRTEAILFLGHAQLQRQPENAIETLSMFLRDSTLDEHYRDLAHWFLAWGHLRNQAPEKASAALQNITDTNSRLYPDAQRLLDLLAE